MADWLISKKYKIEKKNMQTPFAELDLFVTTPGGAKAIIEVKAYTPWQSPLGQRQAARLARARLWLEQQYFCPVHCHLVMVRRDETFTMVEEVLASLV